MKITKLLRAENWIFTFIKGVNIITIIVNHALFQKNRNVIVSTAVTHF